MDYQYGVSLVVSPVVNKAIEQARSLVIKESTLPTPIKNVLANISVILTKIQSILEDAEDKQHTIPILQIWLLQLQDAAYDAQDMLDTFETNLFLWTRKQQVRSFRTPVDAAHNFQNILARLDKIGQEKEKFHLEVEVDKGTLHHAPTLVDAVIRREDGKKEIVKGTLHHAPTPVDVVCREDEKKEIVKGTLHHAPTPVDVVCREDEKKEIVKGTLHHAPTPVDVVCREDEKKEIVKGTLHHAPTPVDVVCREDEKKEIVKGTLHHAPTPVEVVGREDEKKEIVNMLLSDEFDREGGMLPVCIVGEGGLGKTTIAQLVYEDERVIKCFEFRMWIQVSDDLYWTSRTMREMIEPHFLQLSAAKKFLLVLDDLPGCHLDQLHQLYLFGDLRNRCKVLITTTHLSHVPPMRHLRLRHLFKHECWLLLRKIAFNQGNFSWEEELKLEDIGRDIIDKYCWDLPLGVKMIASLLGRNVGINEWQRILTDDRWELRAFRLPTLPAVLLSYEHLPSYLKQCFTYCSLFPMGHAFDKKELVKLWMAEDFIQCAETQKAEEIGSQYFDELLTMSFFEPLGGDKDKYRMHATIHGSAQLISSPAFYYSEASRRFMKYWRHDEKTRHVSLAREIVDGNDVLYITTAAKKLRTLLSHTESLKIFYDDLNKIFDTMAYIRVLDLRSSTILRLPKSIEKLKLLRYLNLSNTQIRKLPKSICNLYHLQTLILLGCLLLLQLPKHFGKLINLRHLLLDQRFWYKCTALPRRIGRLTSLHNLQAFPVGFRKGHGIEELKRMAYLTGTLHISRLENAVKKAVEAKLKQKASLDKLVLEWSDGDAAALQDEDEESLNRALEDLQPHSNLEELLIFGFKGTGFPRWMTDGWLQNLLKLSLKGCQKCKTFSIGWLPHLHWLYLKGMQQLEELQEKFPRAKIVSLDTLKIVNCPQLRKLPFFFNIRHLKIKGCNSLKALPVTPSLMSLVLVDNLILEDWNEMNSSFSELSELKIDSCPVLETLPQIFTPIKVEISDCKLLRALPAPEYSQQLQHLLLDKCDGTLVGAIPESSSLDSLVISNISNATSFPKWPYLPGLKVLHILHCKDLLSLSSQEASPFQGLASLKTLCLEGCSQLVTLPDQGLPTTLEFFSINSCINLQSLGPKDVLKSLTSLKDLYIEDCPRLESLPEDGVCTSLQHLVIRGCPTLMERCREEDGGGHDWSKIMHIPDLEISFTEVSASSEFQKPKYH